MSSSNKTKTMWSSSSSSHQRKSDVFVSFRGDMRYTFISHLFNRLNEAGIGCFRDDDKDDAGKEMDDKILGAIHQARFALVVFSANYATSTWCLNELVEILKCKRQRKNPKLLVIPIFYIKADVVSKWRIDGEFEKALESVDQRARADKKEEWKDALAQAKRISGYELETDASGKESELIGIIVERLVKEIQLRDAIPHEYSYEVFGPFGGKGQKSWNFVDIKGIDVRCGEFIESITFEVDDATSLVPETYDGGNGGKNTFKVKLENPDEYITSFSGYLENAYGSSILINSLTFRTNKRILGPIGREKGDYFSLPSEAGKVISFFGTSGDFLKFIGAKVQLYYPFNSVGLWGSSKTTNWDDGNEHTNVRKIFVEFEPSKGPYIRSITFHYEVKNETSWQQKTHGITADEKLPPVEILDQDEYLTSISGYYTDGGITSLTFQTNKKTTGPITSRPIGDKKERHFSSPATGGRIVGFYGRSGENLEAIGAYFEPIFCPNQIKSIGPFGCPGGSRWELGLVDGVREIVVMYDDGIHYIGFVHNEGRKEMHGGRIGGTDLPVKTVLLDYPREYLTSISGYMREDGAIIRSLTFHSNRRIIGPFGKVTGKYFWYPSTRSKIIGFYGTWGKTLNSIGVYVQPKPHQYPFKIIGPLGGSDGTPWDDGVYTDVRGFRISFSDVIHSIEIAYDNNGSFVLGSEHGQNDNYKQKEVMLDYPKERLISISVWVDKYGNTGQTIVHDLQIFTTKTTQTYGPFIPKSRSKRDKLETFHIPLEQDGGRIVGFFGRAGTCLNSIGARLEPY